MAGNILQCKRGSPFLPHFCISNIARKNVFFAPDKLFFFLISIFGDPIISLFSGTRKHLFFLFKKIMSRQVSNWCWTLNNPRGDDVLLIDNLVETSNGDVVYVIYGMEEAPVTKTPHLQGYIEMKRSVRLSAMKKLMGDRVHLEPRRGQQDEAIEYCKKDGEFYEYGTPKAGTGASMKNLMQTRLVEMKEEIVKGSSRDELFEKDPLAYVLYSRWVEAEIARRKPEHREVRVFLLHGEPGTNKTRFAYDKFPNLYAIPCNTANASVWFNGYEGEDAVLLDDFSGEMPLVQLLRLLDRYRVQVPYKGGYVWFAPHNIIITTNVHPRKWYDYGQRDSSWQALQRRIFCVLDFNNRHYNEDVEYDTGRELDREETPDELEVWFRDLASINDVLRCDSRSGLFKKVVTNQ